MILQRTQEIEAGYVVGADIGGTSLRIALASMDGKVLGMWKVSTAGIRDPNVVVGLVQQGTDELFREKQLPRNLLRAVAAGAPGVTNVEDGVVIATSYLMGWRNVPLRALLEAKLGVPAAVENDVNTAAIAESQIGAGKGVRDFVFIAIGTGIGAGVILNSRLFHGMGWSAGEIGYLLVPGTSVKPVETGEPGALEDLIGGEGIKGQWLRLWREDATPLPRDLMATQIFDYALEGDALAQKVLRQSAEILAYAIYDLAVVLNCPLFVLGGSVGMHPALWKETQEILQQRDKRVQPRLVRSVLGGDAQVNGAVCLALEAASSRVVTA
ncbi:MAG TPA: ROK family protein [Acidobacteriaceae bacterium]|nr:ROK family protein [Acidobacteriaceae bacterium]